MIDLNDMSLADLRKLQKDVEKAIANFKDRHKRAALAAAEAAVRDMGFSLSELVGTAKPAQPKSASVPKYHHPENPALTWSGRGRKLGWILEALAAGKTLESLLIE